MPLYRSRKSATRSEHVHKCMSASQMLKEFPDPKQRLAVCNSLWEDKLSSDLESL